MKHHCNRKWNWHALIRSCLSSHVGGFAVWLYYSTNMTVCQGTKPPHATVNINNMLCNWWRLVTEATVNVSRHISFGETKASDVLYEYLISLPHPSPDVSHSPSSTPASLCSVCKSPCFCFTFPPPAYRPSRVPAPSSLEIKQRFRCLCFLLCSVATGVISHHNNDIPRMSISFYFGAAGSWTWLQNTFPWILSPCKIQTGLIALLAICPEGCCISVIINCFSTLLCSFSLIPPVQYECYPEVGTFSSLRET